jgi:hypothetical protein
MGRNVAKPAPGFCKERVWHPMGNWGSYHQCRRKPAKDGYCRTHHPDTVAGKKAARDRAFDREMEMRRLRHEAEKLAGECADSVLAGEPGLERARRLAEERKKRLGQYEALREEIKAEEAAKEASL